MATGGAVWPLPRYWIGIYGRSMMVGALTIRPFDECPEASELLAEWSIAEWPEYHRGRSLFDVASRFSLVPKHRETLIAEIGGDLVGTVALRGIWEDAPEIPPPWIGGLFVAPERRGAGIGMALVDAAVVAAAEQGHSEVHISIRVDPASYLRRGWLVVGTVAVGDESVTILRVETGV